MNVYFVLVARLHAQVTGGILINILDQLSLCKLIDGLLTREMNTKKREWNNFVITIIDININFKAEDIKLYDC